MKLICCQIIALIFIVYGVYFANYILSFIGIFVFLSAGREYRQIRKADHLEFGKVEDYVDYKFPRLKENQTIDQLTHQTDCDYIVFDEDGQLAGILKSDSLFSFKENTVSKSIKELYLPMMVTISKEDTLKKAWDLMKLNRVKTLPVVENDTVIGALNFSAFDDV